jgi:hypothetical protein
MLCALGLDVLAAWAEAVVIDFIARVPTAGADQLLGRIVFDVL